MSVNGNQRRTATPDPEVLRAEIVRTRAERGETVAALAAKTDVKARASRAAADVRVQVTEVARTPLTWTFVVAGAAVGVLIWLAARRRS